MKNKRLWTRLITDGKGNFLTKDRDLFGDMQLNNYSRNGFRASFNRSVEPGSDLLVEVNLPKHSMPIWATGKVVWSKTSVSSNAEQFEAGIELKEVDLFNIIRVKDECYKDKYLEQVADYAFEMGALTKINNKNILKSKCSNDALFIIYFFAGALLTLINQYFALSYALSITLYFCFIISKRSTMIFDNKYSFKALFSKKTLLRICGLILNNLCSGVSFIRGYIITKSLQNN